MELAWNGTKDSVMMEIYARLKSVDIQTSAPDQTVNSGMMWTASFLF